LDRAQAGARCRCGQAAAGVVQVRRVRIGDQEQAQVLPAPERAQTRVANPLHRLWAQVSQQAGIGGTFQVSFFLLKTQSDYEVQIFDFKFIIYSSFFDF
jgi:hypothetical protein